MSGLTIAILIGVAVIVLIGVVLWRAGRASEDADENPALHEPLRGRLLAAAAAGRYDEVFDTLLRADPDTRDALVWVLARELPEGTWLRCRDAGLAHLGRGVAAIIAGWRARSSRVAQYVSDAAARAFEEHLERAVRELARAAELWPADPAPHAAMLVAGRGLSFEHGLAERTFYAATERDRGCWRAHDAMLQYLCEKWHGSHEAMFAFARDVSSRAPRGSALHLLVLSAHVERWIHYASGDGNERAQGEQYLRDPQVVRECDEAYGRFVAGTEERTSTRAARNAAAFWFFLTRDRDRLRAELHAIGDQWTPAPWAYLGAPRAVLRQARELAIAAS
jgi:hypothetical protein